MQESQCIVKGSITNAGYYRDCIPTLIISVQKTVAQSIPYRNNERVPVHLIIGGTRFNAGIRCGANTPYIKISADLTSEDGKPVRLVDVLFQHGYQLKDKVKLKIQGNTLTLLATYE